MERQDFILKVCRLHNEIYKAMRELMIVNKVNRITPFRNDSAAVIHFDYERSALAHPVDAIGLFDNTVKVHIKDSENHEDAWEFIGLSSDVVYGSIAPLYNCLYEAVATCCQLVSFTYQGERYKGRYVMAGDLGVLTPREAVFVLPSSLREAFGTDSPLDRTFADKVVFKEIDETLLDRIACDVINGFSLLFTEEANLSLPYNELCDELK